MPEIIANNHDTIIKRLLREGHSKIIKQYKGTVAKAKNGYIFPIKIYVNFFFGFQHDFSFSSLLIK